MKPSSTITIAILVLVLLGSLIFIAFFSPRSNSSNQLLPEPISGFQNIVTPTSPVNLNTKPNKEDVLTGDSVFQVQLVDGSVLTTHDFTMSPDTQTTLDKSLTYVLFPKDNTAPLEYEINYLSESKSFVVILAKEPIAETRRAAAEDLMNRLGISNQELCSLSVRVQVPRWVSDFYSDKNLGFPNCPGAVKFSGD
ncbi:hypothetical protein EPO56_01360 [Patescibacteria group bacterium]|nr:MAG: hypothetical protein EPO56_01360 [Patescibacteria group bacterium]